MRSSIFTKNITIIIGILLFNLLGYSLDSFNNLFKQEKEIFIDTKDLNVGQLFILKTDDHHNLLFLDARGSQLLLFNQEGKFLKRIGQRGQGPGEYSMPFGLGVDHEGNIILSDGQSRRINIYDREGNFISSFICSGMHWPPHVICIDSKRNFFLGGFKADLSRPNSGQGLYINKYNSEGKYLKSFYSRNTKQTWFLSLYPFFSFDIDNNDRIYATQMNRYLISIFDSDGNLLKTFGHTPHYFKPPDPNIRIDYSKFKNQAALKEKLEQLSKSWTKIISLNVINDKHLILQIEMNGLIKNIDKKYVLDIWNKEGVLVAGGIQTDYKLLCVDKAGYIYFLLHTDEEKASGKEPTYLIGKYKLTLTKG